MFSFSRTLIVFFALVFSALILLSTTCDASPARPGKVNVVKIIDTAGAIRFEIIESDLVSFLKKEINAEYKKAKSAWHKAKSEWEEKNGKTVFPCPEPVKPEFKVVAKGLQDKDQAQEEVENIQSEGSYCVVQIIQGAEKKTPEIIHNDELKQYKYDVEMAHFEHVKTWAEEKTTFEQAHPEGGFDKVSPAKPKVKVLKKRLKTLEKAEAALKKYTG